MCVHFPSLCALLKLDLIIRLFMPEESCCDVPGITPSNCTPPRSNVLCGTYDSRLGSRIFTSSPSVGGIHGFLQLLARGRAKHKSKQNANFFTFRSTQITMSARFALDVHMRIVFLCVTNDENDGPCEICVLIAVI